MKRLHKANLYCWSEFDQARNIDFHSYFWHRPQGNIVFDPLPLSPHDVEHIKSLGGVSTIILSNSDHVRDAESLAAMFGASICGPDAEQSDFPIECSQWLNEDSALVAELEIYCLTGSKTDGELAFVLEGDTLITGDLIRAHVAGELCMLPEAKLTDIAQAKASVKRMASITGIEAILPGDGWPVFRDGSKVLAELAARVAQACFKLSDY